jgi:alanine racemase
MESATDRAQSAHTWIELDGAAIDNNVAVFRELTGDRAVLTAVVKADAYGHGMLQVATRALAAGAEWLGVFDAAEGLALRGAGIDAPVIVLGPTGESQLDDALAAGFRITVASVEAAQRLGARAGAAAARAHVKVETGTNRQGIEPQELPAVIERLGAAGVAIEGLSTHFADIEDTTDHTFAEQQLGRFEACLARAAELGCEIALPHTACTAATILFDRTHFGLVRVGIGLYGLWPSRETLVSANALGRNRLGLRPVMTWKTRIAQVKPLAAGSFVGYGRTYRATRGSRLAVLPVGYADGYDRRLSGAAHVLIRGLRAPVVGRVCMNMTMVDVTDVEGAAAGDEVVLLGRQGDDAVTAEDLARLVGTINYEIVTRAAPGAPRIVI